MHTNIHSFHFERRVIMGIFNYARKDGCDGIHSHDMNTLISSEDLERYSNEIYEIRPDDYGNTYDYDGRRLY